MDKRERLNLGEKEELVLLAAAILDDKAYGLSLSLEILDQAGGEGSYM